jgi:hypothetical protein
MMTPHESIRFCTEVIEHLKEIRKKMAENQSELDAAIAAVTTAANQLGEDLSVAITALETKIASAGATGVDFSPEVSSLNGIATELESFDAQAVAANAPAAPASVAPASTPTTGS